MKYPNSRILIFAKAPISGQVKTRLIPDLGKEGALDIYLKLFNKTINTVVSANLCPVEIWCWPNIDDPLFQTLKEEKGIKLYSQVDGDLGKKMFSASESALQRGENCLLIGTDCPSLNKHYLSDILSRLSKEDAVIGCADDGGYVALGLSKTSSHLFDDIEWGVSTVAQVTEKRLQKLAWAYSKMSSLADIDTYKDLEQFGFDKL